MERRHTTSGSFGGQLDLGSQPRINLFFHLLAPPILIGCAISGIGWSWWQRTLAGLGELLLVAYISLVLIGLFRRRH
ncbi:hypothetical protein [Streptomyces sp. NBC_00223]|uniref:hypothetical protein n=1 Tax=Streptomyces sp. NBC_00223 TaxID=2976008 RepID=UPI002E2BBE7E|nr:hypothetical protein [Streptomyces sp. NBC_00223]